MAWATAVSASSVIAVHPYSGRPRPILLPATSQPATPSAKQGMSTAKAYDRAVAAVREANADLFARLLTEEYELWLAVPDDPPAMGLRS